MSVFLIKTLFNFRTLKTGVRYCSIYLIVVDAVMASSGHPIAQVGTEPPMAELVQGSWLLVPHCPYHDVVSSIVVVRAILVVFDYSYSRCCISLI